MDQAINIDQSNSDIHNNVVETEITGESDIHTVVFDKVTYMNRGNPFKDDITNGTDVGVNHHGTLGWTDGTSSGYHEVHNRMYDIPLQKKLGDSESSPLNGTSYCAFKQPEMDSSSDEDADSSSLIFGFDKSLDDFLDSRKSKYFEHKRYLVQNYWKYQKKTVLKALLAFCLITAIFVLVVFLVKHGLDQSFSF